MLAAARSAPGSLWEAFVFPFHEQMDRARAMLAAGAIGEVREIQSRFHFVLDDPNDIRLFADLAGGSIQDVGCYPIRLARLLFDAEPDLLARDRRRRVDGPTARTRSCGARWSSPAIAGWCSRAASAAATTRSRASSAPRARSA